MVTGRYLGNFEGIYSLGCVIQASYHEIEISFAEMWERRMREE